RNVQSNENEGIFYYQQQYNNQLYQVSYEIVSPLLVNNCLNKNFLGIEFQQNMEQEHIVLTFGQKEYLECHLKKYLSQYLLG
ncbi:11684_t:CDS:1, partial [Rhizophagus irregularis]